MRKARSDITNVSVGHRIDLRSLSRLRPLCDLTIYRLSSQRTGPVAGTAAAYSRTRHRSSERSEVTIVRASDDDGDDKVNWIHSRSHNSEAFRS